MTPKPIAYFLSVNGNPMSKIPHEHFFDMQHFKKSEFGCIEKKYLQLHIKGCYMLCLMGKQPILLEVALSENLNKISKIVIFGQKWCFCPKISIFIFLL